MNSLSNLLPPLIKIVRIQVNDQNETDSFQLILNNERYDLTTLLASLPEEELNLLKEAIDQLTPPTGIP